MARSLLRSLRALYPHIDSDDATDEENPWFSTDGSRHYVFTFWPSHFEITTYGGVTLYAAPLDRYCEGATLAFITERTINFNAQPILH